MQKIDLIILFKNFQLLQHQMQNYNNDNQGSQQQQPAADQSNQNNENNRVEDDPNRTVTSRETNE